MSRPNGVNDVYAYESTGQLSSRTSSKAAAAIDALLYTYDDSGRRNTKTDSSGTTTYGYNTADRLTSVLAPAGSSLPDETFTYDSAGNQTNNGQTYDAANRLLSDAKYDYAYDNEGNQTSRTERATGNVTTYTWNALHQLTSARLPDGSTVTYRYDAIGRRVEQAGVAGTTRYVNLGANVIAEYDGANAPRASYVTTIGTGNLPGMPLEANVGGTASYPLTDGVGSVTGTTNSSGALSSFAYTAYGTPVGASSGTYSYGTYGYDSTTGLYYARARYYDPSTGRFLSEDPLPAANSYQYGADRPVDGSDPTGQQALLELSVTTAALTAFANAVASTIDTYLWAKDANPSSDEMLKRWGATFASSELISLLGLAAAAGPGVFVFCALAAVTTALVWASIQGYIGPDSLKTEDGQKRILLTCLTVVPSFTRVFPIPATYFLPLLIKAVQ
jgi:RHS repeat-associated protein